MHQRRVKHAHLQHVQLLFTVLCNIVSQVNISLFQGLVDILSGELDNNII